MDSLETGTIRRIDGNVKNNGLITNLLEGCCVEVPCLDKNPPDIVISLDRTGSGWRLLRYDGTPVNFALIADSPDIAFAHKNGFMAKTKERLPLAALITLVSKAVTAN